MAYKLCIAGILCLSHCLFVTSAERQKKLLCWDWKRVVFYQGVKQDLADVSLDTLDADDVLSDDDQSGTDPKKQVMRDREDEGVDVDSARGRGDGSKSQDLCGGLACMRKYKKVHTTEQD